MADETINILGRGSFADELASRDREAQLAEETTFVDALGAAWQGNLGPQAWKTLSSKYEHEPELDFSSSKWLETHGTNVPKEYHDRFSGVRSRGEAAELAARLQDDLHNQKIIGAKGATGIAAVLLAGMADVDAPLMLMSGGVTKATTTGTRILKSTTAGAAVGTGFGAAHNVVDPLAETSDIIFGGLLGAGFGGAGGLALNRSFDDAASEFAEMKPSLTDNPYETWTDSDASLGAQYRGGSLLDTEEMSDTQKAILEESRATMRTAVGPEGETVSDLMEDMAGAKGLTAAAGRRLAESVAKVPGLRSLFDDVAAGGTIMKSLAYDLLESPAGRVRNNNSASGLVSKYERMLATEALPIDDAFQAWHKASVYGVRDVVTGQSRRTFDLEVLEEMNNRAHGGNVTSDPLIKQAADALDAHYRRDLDLKKGREGETAVDGAEGLNYKSGHYTRQWDGASMRKLMRHGVPRKQITDLVAASYRKMHPELKKAGYDMVVAKAIVRRALSKEDGIDSNMLMTMDADGQEFLRQMLKDSGYGEEEFQGLLTALRGKSEERGMLGTNKVRIELDMRMGDGDISMMDLINTNITELVQRNTRATAGAAALARKGITNRGQRKTIIDAAVQEQIARGDLNPQKHRETLENMFTYFDGGPIAGGIDPMVSRIKRIANLGLLNQMGLTQLGETGAQIAAVGVSTWMRHAKDVFRTLEAEGPHGRLAAELRPFLGELGNDHNLFRPELMLDDLRNDAGYALELEGFLRTLDAVLGKGQRLQGYISGFHYIKSQQQKIAVTSMADKVFQRIRDGVDDAAMRDIGINPEQFKKYLDKVEFSDEGYVNKLNMNEWDVADADDFATALNRYTNQVVQRGMVGEDSQWWHSSWGAIFSHLKTFPLMALQKQAARNMNMGAPVATAAVTMGLATAGIAYTVKQIINNKGVPTAEEAARGAFGMSNMTGWFPMFADPVASILGMEDYRFDQYGRHSAQTGIIDVPPAIPTLNRMLHIPGALNPIGDMSKNDRIRSLQAAPLIGNAVGFTAIWNAMK